MNKQERIDAIREAYDNNGKTFAEILANDTYGVKPATIKGDLLGLYPDDATAINSAFDAIAKDDTKGEPATDDEPTVELSADDKEYSRLLVEAIAFDPGTGEPMGKPFIHTVNRRSWPQFIKNHKSTGLTVLKVEHLAPGNKPFPFDDYDERTKKARAKVLKFRSIKA